MPSETTPKSVPTQLRCAIGLSLCGAVVFAAGADRFASIRQLGEIVLGAGLLLGIAQWIITEVTREVRTVNRPADDAFSEGWEAGYDKGWRDRDGESRPKLVILPTASASDESADSCSPTPHVTAERASK